MPNRFQKKLISDALDYEHKLNEWEQGFIKDLADKNDDYELSPRQNKQLNRIGQKIQD